MAKYSLEFRKEFIKLMETNDHSISSAANKLGVSFSVAQRWWSIYQEHGMQKLLEKKNSYSGDFKINAVKYIQENNMSTESVAVLFGIPSASTLAKWVDIYIKEGEEGLMAQKKGVKKKEPKECIECIQESKSVLNDEENLLKEIQYLKAEVSYLKKSIALKKLQSHQIRKKQK